MNNIEDTIYSKHPENYLLHVPLSGYKTKGIGSYDTVHFSVTDGNVKINEAFLKNAAIAQVDKLKLNVVKNNKDNIVRLLYGNKIISETTIVVT